MIIFLFAVSIAVFLIALVSVVLTIIMREGVTGHWCRHCKTPLPDHLAETCPTCGMNLPRHFVVHKHAPKPFPTWSKTLLWTAFMLLPAVVVSIILLRLVDHWEITATRFVPNSGAYDSITLQPIPSRDDDAIKVKLILETSSGSDHELVIEPHNQSYETFNADGDATNHNGALTEHVMTEWMASQNVDVTKKGVAEEVAVIIKQIGDDLVRSKHLEKWPGKTSQYKVRGIMRRWAPALLAAGWFAVWLLGLLRLLHGSPFHCHSFHNKPDPDAKNGDPSSLR